MRSDAVRRISTDLVIIIILVSEYGLFQMLGQNVSVSIWLLVFSPLLVWPVSAALLALIRATAELRLFRSRVHWWIRGVEWMAVVTASAIISCSIDVRLHPAENVQTVIGANLLILFLPTLLSSTTVYLVSFAVIARYKRSQGR
jgi:hypothetical protein